MMSPPQTPAPTSSPTLPLLGSPRQVGPSNRASSWELTVWSQSVLPSVMTNVDCQLGRI